MLDNYFKHVAERRAQGIPPLPLNPEDTAEVCYLLEAPPVGEIECLFALLKDRVSPGVDPSAKVKAAWLADIARGKKTSPGVSPSKAVFLLGTMIGGYNVGPLVEFLEVPVLSQAAADALKGTILVYGTFDRVWELSRINAAAGDVLKSWAEGEWFLRRPEFPKSLTLTVYKVDGEINTDDFSPAKQAATRPDIPLHALTMGGTRFPDGNATIAEFRAENKRVVFVGDVVGTGSSRKSACNSVMWHIGEDIPFVPNKRRGGVVLGGLIAPIFFNTTEDSGGLPIQNVDVTKMKTGGVIVLDLENGTVKTEAGELLSKFELKPSTLRDEFRAGGRLNLIIGRALTQKARAALKMGEASFFIPVRNPVPKNGQAYSLAQKIVGRACGVEGILPGSACEPKMTTVGSQDTTGPMTADELKELACLEFQADLFMQSFCHTAAYPKPADVKIHKFLPGFITERKGVSLRPGDGVIHSWLNRLLLPDTMGTGGDSHTRFPIGLSFPAGSGLVAFAGALGFMPLDMPESVLVRFQGCLNPGITLRDLVNAIPFFAIKKGLLTVAKKGKVNVFNGRVLEMEGLPDLTVDQAYELTDASAERSAAGAVIALSVEKVVKHLRSEVALMSKMIVQGYGHAETLKRRIAAAEAWLAKPALIQRDKKALEQSYAAVLDINLAEIKEPILACPNDPDDVKILSEVAGDKIDEVFIGSCMTNIGHFRAAGRIFDKAGTPATKIWLTPPTKMDEAQLKKEGYYSIFSQVGGRTEIPGCSLCMGNQARVAPKATILSTSTRNFDDRMGDGARVYLGSAELSAIAAIKGALPTPAEYFEVMKTKVLPAAEELYKPLDFAETKGISLSYAGDR
ncbi:MAG: bifunctional aconitate hydratase 2/2-methylisocitrate dehydratase [Candidatus Aminicenantes bacterium]|nr:bifunctional aconitate hydratase 2/2-methylisocitrate dehydratase [Candidatus Aminicenantes bacterium]